MSDTVAHDWRTMEAGRLLDEVIARRLGLPAVDIYSRVAEPGSPGRWRYNELGYSKTYHYDSGSFNDVAPVPRYSTDLNVALGLPIDEGVDLEIYVFGDTAIVRDAAPVMSSLRLASPEYETGKRDELALLRCRAWLAYQDRISAD